MSRYKYVTVNGVEVDIDDWMLTENGIEALQIKDDKVVLILVLPDGSLMYDYESGKAPDEMRKAKAKYDEMIKHQQDSFKERANQIIAEAVEAGKRNHQPGDPDEDEGEGGEGPMIEIPKLDEEPAGYA